MMKIELQQISKSYGAQTVFEGINVHFEAGKRYPIIGQNGSGKSTLLQVISGYITPNTGAVSYLNQDGNIIPIEQWYRHQAIAAPYLDLFDELNSLETIFLHGKLKHLLKTQEEILADIALADHANKPLGQLSSGMRQRLKLALAIYSDTSILLLDEPTSNLDKAWTTWFQERLMAYTSERVVIICTNSQEAELAVTDQEVLSLSV